MKAERCWLLRCSRPSSGWSFLIASMMALCPEGRSSNRAAGKVRKGISSSCGNHARGRQLPCRDLWLMIFQHFSLHPASAIVLAATISALSRAANQNRWHGRSSDREHSRGVSLSAGSALSPAQLRSAAPAAVLRHASADRIRSCCAMAAISAAAFTLSSAVLRRR